jgi:hypothetical protein
MKKIIVGLCLSFFASVSFASVITFDDLSGNPADTITDGYQDFNWGLIGSVSNTEFPGSGFETGVVSGAKAAFNQYGVDASISLALNGTFDFIGAFFTAGWIGDYFHELSFEGYLDGVLLYSTSSSFAITDTNASWIQLDWAGIDQLNIYSNLAGWDQWVMDDFTVDIHAVSVPESSSLAMLLLGLVGLVVMRRRSI